ncbi:hypothetical protein QM565_06070 [Geitlerinema splendidum]|nr:hypothetical protein [Geitlerinema splendidum]
MQLRASLGFFNGGVMAIAFNQVYSFYMSAIAVVKLSPKVPQKRSVS